MIFYIVLSIICTYVFGLAHWTHEYFSFFPFSASISPFLFEDVFPFFQGLHLVVHDITFVSHLH